MQYRLNWGGYPPATNSGDPRAYRQSKLFVALVVVATWDLRSDELEILDVRAAITSRGL